MNMNLKLVLLGCLIIGVAVNLQGCAKSSIKMPENLPPIIKTHKHFVVYGGRRGVRDTGVYLDKGDIYSIIATGGINMCPMSNNCMFNSSNPASPGQFITGKIGRNKFLTAIDVHGNVVENHYPGQLFLGYRASYPDDDAGAFYIDIIVWAKKDHEAIYDFYKEMNETHPDNTALEYALFHAERRKKYAETASEIEYTKKEIENLREILDKPAEKGQTDIEEEPEGWSVEDKAALDSTETITALESIDKQSKIEQLNAKLAALEEQQAKLEEMTKRFEEEKKKSAALSKQLAEGEKKQQQLLTRLKKGSKAPPVVVIASPQNNSKVEVNVVQINGVAEDEKGIERIDIYINGKPITLQHTRGMSVRSGEPHTRYEFKERVPLHIGENTVRVVALDTVGLSTEKTLTLHYAERRKRIWAVIVGIDRYPNIRHLNYAAKDARAMYDHLVGFNQVPAENVTLLINREATLTRLRSALGTHLKNNAAQDDMVIIFFAGHGATEKDAMSPDGDGLEKYLLPFDADPRDLYATALPMEEISRIFNRISSDRLVFIADSCYSGASGGRTIGIKGIRASLSDAFFDRITGGKGRVIISASGANEVSAESEELEQGVFTYYLLEGLKGKADIDGDNLVTLDEAFRFVSEHVPRATGQEQHPVKKGTVEGRFVLSVVP